MVKSIPDGHHTVTPYLSLRGAAAAIDFYKRAFGATEIMRIPGPGETIGHAEIKIGDSPIMLADEFAPLEFLSPQSRGGSTVHIHLYVDDVDTTVAQGTSSTATARELSRIRLAMFGTSRRIRKIYRPRIWLAVPNKQCISLRMDNICRQPASR